MNANEAIECASLEELIDWWRCEEAPRWAKPGYSFFNRVARQLSKSGPRGIQVLKSQLESDADPQKKSIALLELSHKDTADSDVIEHLVHAFYQDDPRWKECALAGLIQSGQFILARRDVESVLTSDNKWAAAAAMDYLSYAKPSVAVQLFKKGLQDASPVLRAHSCSQVGQRNLKELTEEVRQLLDDKDIHVRIAAQTALELLEFSKLHPPTG